MKSAMKSVRNVAQVPTAPGDCSRGRWLQSWSIVVSQRVDVIEPKTWMCLICGWIYDEAAGDAEHGIAAGTAWAAVPMNWTCPECGARKEDFEMVQL